ncbi:MAG: hypothetical protein KC680_01310 [Candidatus Peregrinibacteria bacterium]|nr:hypothetical protein [Candidatus Peregrinibacteria bacterium]MCB9808125.1 hypothetical protein [Candidatus Peribacteria bacterium]
MTSLDTASALYDDVVNGNEQSASSLASELERRAREEFDTEVAEHLQNAAADIRSSLSASFTITELPDGVAGQAQLGSDTVWIDQDSIKSRDGDRLIDTGVAEDIAAHEQEHTKQSAQSDQQSVTIHGREFDAREVREAAAISVQQNIDFLSAEYMQITAALPMDAEARMLVRKGEFSALERKLAA